MEAAIAQHRRELDDMLARQGDTIDQIARRYVSQIEHLEVPSKNVDALLDSVKASAQAIANPYNLILLAYLLAVALQLFYLSRSAVGRRWRNVVENSTRAKVYALLTVVSLAATWYHMLLYLHASYQGYFDRLRLAGQEVTTIPKCDVFAPPCFLSQVTAHALRTSQWLRDTSLFKEAWLSVVRRPVHWLWSIEVCLFCVGTFAFYLVYSGSRLRVPHAWAYMLLGQSCAISVAYNLFNLAVAVREDAPRSKIKRTDAERMPPPASPSSRSKAAHSSPDATSYLLNALLALTGLFAVYVVPSTMRNLLLMHLFPLAISLTALQGPVSASSAGGILRLSTFYLVLGTVSFGLRAHAIWQAQDALPNRFLEALFENHAQSSISFDTILVHISAMVQLAFANQWLLLLLTPVLGPSSTLAFCLAREERAGESASGKASSSRRKSSASTEKTATPSKRRSSAHSVKESGAATTDASDSEAASTVEKRAPPRKQSAAKPRKSRAKASTRGDQTSASETEHTDRGGETSDAASSVAVKDTPAARAKKTPRRPRKQDAVDGVELVSAVAETTRKTRTTRQRKTSSEGGAKPRGRPKKNEQ